MFWQYVAPLRGDVAATLEALRQEEFAAGRYYRSHRKLPTIERVLFESGVEGTRSILDMEQISLSPEMGAAAPVSDDRLDAIFGTARPTRQMIERFFGEDRPAIFHELLEEIRRGEGRYIIVRDGDEPTDVVFFGYSFG